MNGKFYNKMEFPIPMRKTWLPDSPAIKLQSGEIIEGPYDLLIQFKFLAPLPFDFHKVDSRTQAQTFEYTDNTAENRTEPVIISSPMQMKNVLNADEDGESPPVMQQPMQVKEVNIVPREVDPSTLPFDPKTVQWIGVKIEELKTACKVLNIDVSHIDNLPKKNVKWELIKLVKKACGITGK